MTASERVSTAGPPTLRRIAVVLGLVLLPVGAILFASAPLLHASGWTAAALVVGGAVVLTAGIGLVSAPAHDRHVGMRHRSGDETDT